MRNFTITALALGALTLFACQHDKGMKRLDTADCPVDTGIDTGVDTADTSVTGTCTDSTGTYSIGDTWTCPDGCNTCGCLDSDVIASTNLACDDTGTPPDTGAVDTGTDTGASDTGSGGTDTSAP